MRILQVVADLKPANGVAEVVLNLSDALVPSDVVIATTHQAGNESPRRLKRDDVRVVRFKPCCPHFLCFSWEMMRELGAEVKHADVVHVHGAWSFPVWWGCHLALKYRKTLIRTPHGSFLKLALAKSAIKKKIAAFFFENYYLAQASVVHATSQEEVVQLREYLPDIRALTFIPNGVEMYAIAPKVDKRLGDPKKILFLGRLHPLKGLELLLSAWAKIKGSTAADVAGSRVQKGLKGTDELPFWQLVIAGPDENGLKSKLITQAKKLGLRVDDKCVDSFMLNCVSAVVLNNAVDDNKAITHSGNHALTSDIIFSGPLYGEEKTRVLRNADLFVLPTHSENFGMVVAEALVAGVPVITTKGAPWSELMGKQAFLAEWQHSGVADLEDRRGVARAESSTHTAKLATPASPANPAIAANGRCGWWIDIGVEPLVGALKEAMGLSDEERRVMGENGRRLVETKYRWETVAEKMAAVYSEIVKCKP